MGEGLTGGGWREREERKEGKLWLVCKINEKDNKSKQTGRVVRMEDTKQAVSSRQAELVNI